MLYALRKRIVFYSGGTWEEDAARDVVADASPQDGLHDARDSNIAHVVHCGTGRRLLSLFLGIVSSLNFCVVL
jgi:hypothetical protein